MHEAAYSDCGVNGLTILVAPSNGAALTAGAAGNKGIREDTLWTTGFRS